MTLSPIAHLDPRALDELYLRYGFQRSDSGSPDVRVYLLDTGYFRNIDIVPLNASVDPSLVAERFTAAGFACAVRSYRTNNEAEVELFRGFFAADAALERLRTQYDRFSSSQKRSIGTDYTYIHCPFTSTSKVQPESTIVTHILDLLSRRGAQFILLEAAAGFGKTCTAYETLRAVAVEGKRNIIFAELSRNRQATIFRYVLLDEIDRNYPSLHMDLVTSEIQSGRLPLLIDGFDELLYRKPDASFTDAESMLDTIGELLRHEAKVILTTRKTAIFANDDFHHWLSARSGDFTTTRIALAEPDLADWLGHIRVDLLTRSKVPLHSLSNPVLLSFLRTRTDEEFGSLVQQPDSIVSQYFMSLLSREQERQSLNIAPDDQLTILRALAWSFVELNIRSETRELIAFLITEKSRALLESARKTYSGSERPTIDQLAEKLAGHALLDRGGRELDAVAFINDFVLGILVGDTVVATDDRDSLLSEEYIEISSTAFVSRSREQRQSLWGHLGQELSLVDPQTQMTVDMQLLGRASREHANTTFENMDFVDTEVGTMGMSDCVFIKCSFSTVVFNLANMPGTGLLNCRLFNCRALLGSGSGAQWALGCDEDGGSVLDQFGGQTVDPDEPPTSQSDALERKVLEQFWPVGKDRAQLRRALRTLFLGLPHTEYRAVKEAIESLRKSGYIAIADGGVQLQTAMMGDIRRKLGRQ